MERETSSSRSPDSSCPDYYSYSGSLEERANESHSSGAVDTLISSSTGNRLSSSTFGGFQTHLLEGINRTWLDPEVLPRGHSTLQNENGVINFSTVGNYHQPEASLSTANSGGLSSANYQNSHTSSETGSHITFATTIGQVQISQGPPSYTCPKMPYFASSSSMLPVPTTEIVSYSKTERSHVVSSLSSDSTHLTLPSSNKNFANIARQQKISVLSQDNIVAQVPVSTNHNPPAKQHLPSHNINAQQLEKSAKNSHKERGVKRKSSLIAFHLNSDYLTSAASSSTSYAYRERNMSKNHKKSEATSSSSSLQVENVDDDIQIITPEANRDSYNSSFLSKSQPLSASTSSGFSGLASNHHQPVISDGCRFSSGNTVKPTVYETVRNQRFHQTIPEVPLVQDFTNEDFEQFIDSVLSAQGEIASSDASTAAASTVETITIPHVSEVDDSSSSSILSVHEVNEDNSFNTNKRSSPILEKVPNVTPSLITIDDSPKTGEALELKAKQEAENVKEDFKKLLEDELICNICTELLIKPITLGCSHTFCKFCISEWKGKKNQCPMCRATIVTETPCLFLDNFISKAVEQLDPASVEKRLEMIESREELLKNKVSKPPAQLPQSLNLPQRMHQTLNLPFYMTYQSYSNIPQPMNLHAAADTVQQNLLHQGLDLFPSRASRLQQSLNMLQRPSTIPQQPSIVRQLPSNLLHQSPNPSHVPMNGYFYF